MADPLFLLDTNICIYVLADAAGLPAERLGRCRPGSVMLSAISLAELMLGIIRDDRAVAHIQRFTDVIPTAPFDAAAARAYCAMPFRRGRFDRLIAAHALSLGLTLVTNNESDFADVPGLKIENWTLSPELGT